MFVACCWNVDDALASAFAPGTRRCGCGASEANGSESNASMMRGLSSSSNSSSSSALADLRLFADVTQIRVFKRKAQSGVAFVGQRLSTVNAKARAFRNRRNGRDTMSFSATPKGVYRPDAQAARYFARD